MLPVLQIGPIAVQTPELLIILGIWIGLSLADKWAPHLNIDSHLMDNIVLLSLVSGVIGARLLYATRYADIFLETPISLISLNPGLLDPIGGVSIGFLTALIYGNRKKIGFWTMMDALTPLFNVSLIFFSLSQFASGKAFGIETSLPWGIFLWGARRHPTQIYTALVYLLILISMWPRSSGRYIEVQSPGIKFLAFTALSATARIFFEFFRGDSDIWLYNLRTTQIIAWIVLAMSLIRLTIILRSSQD